MAECYCDCGGKLKEYTAIVKVCQKCKKIPDMDTILDVLRGMGVKEDTLTKLKKDVHFAPV